MNVLVAETIHSDNFWGEVENVISIKKPSYVLIKFVYGESPKNGRV